MKTIKYVALAVAIMAIGAHAQNPTRVFGTNGIACFPTNAHGPGNVTVGIDTNSAWWIANGGGGGGSGGGSKLVGARYIPLIVSPEHNSIGGSTTNNLAVIMDFAQFTATNAVLAWGAYSTSTNAQQEFYRGAVLQVPVDCQAFGATALVFRVYGSSTSADTNRIDILITDRQSGGWWETNGVATATAEDWTDVVVLKSGTMFTNAMSGRTLHVRINPFAWYATTAAVDTVVKIYGQ